MEIEREVNCIGGEDVKFFFNFNVKSNLYVCQGDKGEKGKDGIPGRIGQKVGVPAVLRL